jgi:hypothetical protein
MMCNGHVGFCLFFVPCACCVEVGGGESKMEVGGWRFTLCSSAVDIMMVGRVRH